MENKYRKISQGLLIIYFLTELLRIGSLLVGSVIFKLSVNNIGSGTSSPVSQVYYFLGETFRPAVTGLGILCGVMLILCTLYVFFRLKINLNIFKKMLMVNSSIIIITLYLLYIAANVFGITPAIYNYCTYNLSSIIVILLLYGITFITTSITKKLER